MSALHLAKRACAASPGDWLVEHAHRLIQELWSLLKSGMEVSLHLLTILDCHLLHFLQVVYDLTTLAHLLDKLLSVSLILIETLLETLDQPSCPLLIVCLLFKFSFKNSLALSKLIAVIVKISNFPAKILVLPLHFIEFVRLVLDGLIKLVDHLLSLLISIVDLACLLAGLG